MSKIAIYTLTKDRAKVSEMAIKALHRDAGIDFDHYVWDQGSSDSTPRMLKRMRPKLKRLYLSDENVGQNIAANNMLDDIMREAEYDWIIRFDDDILPRSRRFLRKLIRCAKTFESNAILPTLSPHITKLNHPPETFATGDDVGFKYEVVGVLGGMCRIHHWSVFKDFRYNRFGALGFGEAHEMADRAALYNIPMIRIPSIRVEHWLGHDEQKKRLPKYFGFVEREVGRYVGYGL